MKPLRASFLPLVACCVATALSACSDRSGNPVALRTDTTTTTPLVPEVFDLRFKGVGVLSSTGGVGTADLLAGETGLTWSQYDSAAGSPMSLGNIPCGPSFCSWALATFALPSAVARLATAYRVGVSTDLPLYTRTGVIGDTVITSLDLEPIAGAFALSEFVMTQSGNYRLFQERVPINGLQAAASSEGAAKRVITAVTFDEGQVRYLSYAWDQDSTAGYEAKFVQATLSTAVDSARALAAEGYVITALGGDTDNGFALIGTRVAGATAPRSLVLDNLGTTVLAGLPSGYAPIGYLTDGPGSGVSQLLLER